MTALLLRDLALAVRAGGGFGLGLAFFLITCTLVPFGVGPQGGTLALIAPGILWVGALLACLLFFNRADASTEVCFTPGEDCTAVIVRATSSGDASSRRTCPTPCPRSTQHGVPRSPGSCVRP